MNIYFNGKYLLSFDNPNGAVSPEQIRATIAKKRPAIKNAIYEIKDGDIYFSQTARRLG